MLFLTPVLYPGSVLLRTKRTKCQNKKRKMWENKLTTENEKSVNTKEEKETDRPCKCIRNFRNQPRKIISPVEVVAFGEQIFDVRSPPRWNTMVFLEQAASVSEAPWLNVLVVPTAFSAGCMAHTSCSWTGTWPVSLCDLFLNLFPFTHWALNNLLFLYFKKIVLSGWVSS